MATRRPSRLTAASTDAGWGAEARERQAANLLGALALTLADRLEHAVTAAARLSSSDAAALSALHHFLDSPNVGLLARVLGLSSPGAVRLLDRLQRDGLARRVAGTDGRVTSVALTAAGHRRAQAVTRARSALAERALEALSPAEQRQFGVLAGKILAGLIGPAGATRWTCRLCDLAPCGRPQGHCRSTRRPWLATAAPKRVDPVADLEDGGFRAERELPSTVDGLARHHRRSESAVTSPQAEPDRAPGSRPRRFRHRHG
jgi:DNA-binding MarR family transcriptional regulator